jgi:hypothetical protein
MISTNNKLQYNNCSSGRSLGCLPKGRILVPAAQRRALYGLNKQLMMAAIFENTEYRQYC